MRSLCMIMPFTNHRPRGTVSPSSLPCLLPSIYESYIHSQSATDTQGIEWHQQRDTAPVD